MFSDQEHYYKVLNAWKPIREKIYWVIVRITNDKSLAEDVLQEALITAIDKYQTLKDETKFEPWFVTIAIRKAYELLESKRLYVDIEDIESNEIDIENDDSVYEISSSIQYKDMIRLILEHLKPENKRWLFYLRYIEDRPMENIMSITGIKVATLKTIFHRMRKEISTLLAKEYDLGV